jgi:hypothetical protein
MKPTRAKAGSEGRLSGCNGVDAPLQIERPAALLGHTFAHGLPTLAMALDVAVLQFDTLAVRPLGDEGDLNLARLGGRSRAARSVSYPSSSQSDAVAGFRIHTLRVNAYAFLSDPARNASAKYGGKSVSLLATKSSD